MNNWQQILEPLLNELHWKGKNRHLCEAMKSLVGSLDIDRFRDVMVHLGYLSKYRCDHKLALNEEMLPVVYIDDDHIPHLLTNSQHIAELPDSELTFLLFSPANAGQEISSIPLKKQIERFNPILQQVLLVSLIIGVVSLAPVFFNRAIYDNIIGASSSKGLFMLSVGVLTALLAELMMRQFRNRRLALFGGRIDHYVSCSVFERLMFLPPHYTERASVSAQLARLRDFETVREFFTGPLASLIFELPLVAIYLIAMAIVGGWLAAVPLALLLAYIILIATMNGIIKESGQASATASTKRQEFLMETVTRLHSIRLAGMEQTWQQRCRQISARAAQASFRAGFNAQILETISYILMTAGGIATLAFGVNLVIAGTLTTGGLIAAMMLVWRIVSPLQVCCAAITRIQQISSSSKQVQNLLSVTPEHSTYSTPTPIADIKGQIAFHRVSLRYTPDAEPALLGVEFDITPGKIVAIGGGNGSGKSTILKVMMGMYPPQSGSVRLDGVDIRQLDPLALRQAISYVPQVMDFFPGSIRDNLLFSYPAASEEDIINALKDSRAYDEVMQLPKQADTIIAGEKAASISFLLRQRINLARAYVKPAILMLFDEGSYSLGKEDDVAFFSKIADLRGKSTVLLVTHREDHMRMADILLMMNNGELTHMGPPEQVLQVLRGKR